MPAVNQCNVAVSGTSAAAANNVAIPATASQYGYLAGFSIDGFGATGASTVTVTITGVQNTLTYLITVPAGATTRITSPLNINFSPPLQSSAPNTAITVNVPSFGAGNTTVAVNAWGFTSL